MTKRNFSPIERLRRIRGENEKPAVDIDAPERVARRVFNTADGAKLLDWIWFETYGRRPSADASDGALREQHGARIFYDRLVGLLTEDSSDDGSNPEPAGRKRRGKSAS